MLCKLQLLCNHPCEVPTIAYLSWWYISTSRDERRKDDSHMLHKGKRWVQHQLYSSCVVKKVAVTALPEARSSRFAFPATQNLANSYWRPVARQSGACMLGYDITTADARAMPWYCCCCCCAYRRWSQLGLCYVLRYVLINDITAIRMTPVKCPYSNAAPRRSSRFSATSPPTRYTGSNLTFKFE